ncbi:glycoside hydrolase family 127 protein [Rugosimonospora acidiphila]|uniref:Glycoside hydrolase family 127 protein n=1 Tax=Rugosimonospora acidiphila TaxID=556531 RepID=A0ABP9RMB9_9ACTN
MDDVTFDRRTALRAAGTAVAGAALGTALGAALPSTGALRSSPAYAARTDFGVSVFPFPLSAVKLSAGPFLDNMNRTLAYLSYVDPDRLLYTFRTNVHISTTAQAVGGWESPTTELRGHSTGHLLSALAQAYANTGNSTYKTKGDYLVSSLAACQAASPGAGFHTGYLSAFPENFFDRLESGQTVWAPYYTIHKIMAGLLDQYLVAGNTQALTVVTNMAAWVKTRTDPLSSTTMQNVVLRTEFGGMPEVLTNLYQVTANPDHLTTAQRFDHAQIENPLASDQDQLSGFHGNTQIPKIIGAIREYHATGTTRYHDIATNFWDIVINSHTYVIGGNTNGEYFQTPNAIASQLSDTTCECCNTYNMLKLSRQLFFTNPARADYVDYYERALFNQILGQQDPNSSHGFVAYYIPLRAGGIKTYSNDYSNFTCDHGTGMESNTKYADSIYFYSGETLYVNLFIASTLTWPGRGITVTQATTFPTASTSRLTVTGSGHIAMKIRVPSWTSGMTVKVNGVTQSVTATPGSYLTIDRTWASGDYVDLTMPATLTFPRANDNANVGAVKYGAIVYAGEYGNTDLNSVLPTLQTGSLVQDPANPLHFTGTASTGSVSLIPFYKTHHERYTVYWNLSGGGTPAPTNVAWYKFDETSGTSAADAFGNGKTATLTGTTTWVAGRTGNAVHLNGTTGYVRLPNGLLSGATDFTISAWVKLDSVVAWTRIFDFGSGSGSYMFLTPRSSSGTVRFAITTGGAGGEQQINGPAALASGVWTQAAVTLSGSTGTLYVNGAAVASNTAITLRPSSLGSTTQTWLGRSQYADPYLTGALDSVRIYGRALSASEIGSLYTAGN